MTSDEALKQGQGAWKFGLYSVCIKSRQYPLLISLLELRPFQIKRIAHSCSQVRNALLCLDLLLFMVKLIVNCMNDFLASVSKRTRGLLFTKSSTYYPLCPSGWLGRGVRLFLIYTDCLSYVISIIHCSKASLCLMLFRQYAFSFLFSS